MVTINSTQVIVGKDGFTPVMHQHNLKCLQSTRKFTEGENLKCYVAKYADSRFAVWDASWLHHNKYEVFTERELHEVFEESI